VTREQARVKNIQNFPNGGGTCSPNSLGIFIFMDNLQIQHHIDQIELHQNALKSLLLDSASSEKISDLEDEITGLESRINELEDEVEESENLGTQIDDAINLLEDLKTDDFDSVDIAAKIDEIIKVLS